MNTFYDPKQEIVDYFLENCMKYETDINNFKKEIPHTLSYDLL